MLHDSLMDIGHPWPIIDEVWQRIHIDYMGTLFPMFWKHFLSGQKYLSCQMLELLTR